jgi:hypothetical protein
VNKIRLPNTPAAGSRLGAPAQPQAGRGGAGQLPSDHAVQPAGLEDLGDVGLDLGAGTAGAAAGQAGLQLGQLPAGLGQGLLEPLGLALM